MSLIGYTLASGSVLTHNGQSSSLQRIAGDGCADNPLCTTLPNVCNNPALNQALVKTLCPVKCGLCPTPYPYQGCVDSARLNCTNMKHQICSLESAFHLCPRTCSLCDRNPAYHPCRDHVQDLECAGLPHPCDDAVGLIVCPSFCGICSIATEPATPVMTHQPATTLPTTPIPSTTPLSVTTSLLVTVPASGPCDVNPCTNGGSCFANSFRFICSCPDGYSGPSCNIEPPPTTTTAPPTTVTTPVAPTTNPECYVIGKEVMYQGHANVTVFGKPCQIWSDYPRKVTMGKGPEEFSDGRAGYNSNFCRQTVNAIPNSFFPPFCYFSDDPLGWAYCSIPVCH